MSDHPDRPQVARLPDGFRSRAVLLGTSTFADPTLSALPAVANNLTDLSALLTSQYGTALPAAHCTVRHNQNDVGAIGELLENVARQAEDMLLIYYSGHGLVDVRGELHLSLPGTRSDLLRWTALPFSRVREVVADSAARNRILILDCCFSGRAIESMADQQSVISGQVEITGTYTLTSTTANSPAQAPWGARHTAFSGALVELLGGGAPDEPELLTLHDIYRHLVRVLQSRGLPRPEQRGTNTTDQLALARNAHYLPPPAPPAPPAPAPVSPTPPPPVTPPLPNIIDPLAGATGNSQMRRRLSIVGIVVVVIAAGLVTWLVTSSGSGSGGHPGLANTGHTTAQTPPATTTVGPCKYTSTPSAPAPTGKNEGLPADPNPTPNSGTVSVDLVTSLGDIPMSLDRAEAPCTVQSFLHLANQKFFDDTPCHRETDYPDPNPLYVLQCGNPTGSGSGAPGYTIPDEKPKSLKAAPETSAPPSGEEPPVVYPAGTVAMANSGQPHSGGSQFFLVYKDSKLPPDYTVFGTITSAGMDTLNKIAAAGITPGTDPGSGQASSNDGKPTKAVTVIRAREQA
jgi:cyclophilin family peptidyl-prolyl cis-trans isomerase